MSSFVQVVISQKEVKLLGIVENESLVHFLLSKLASANIVQNYSALSRSYACHRTDYFSSMQKMQLYNRTA